jgi:hypothetical protein
MGPQISTALGPPVAMMTAPPPTPEIVAPPMEIMPPVEMALPPPAPPPEPPPPPPTDAPGLRAAYGAPDFIRREDESELWRYDVAGCAVFFFLYRDGSALKIRYAETSPRGKAAPVDPACLKTLSGRASASASRRMS